MHLSQDNQEMEQSSAVMKMAGCLIDRMEANMRCHCTAHEQCST
jgi:hypothetical protein